MIPHPNSYVKIYLKNNISLEGIVINWTDGKTVLKANTTNNLLIIQNTKENVIAYQIIINEEPENTLEKQDNIPNNPVFTGELESSPEMPRDITKRALTLVELKKEKIKEEQQRARELLTSFEPSYLLEATQYGIPSNIRPPPGFDNNIRKETGTHTSEYNRKLSILQKQKRTM